MEDEGRREEDPATEWLHKQLKEEQLKEEDKSAEPIILVDEIAVLKRQFSKGGMAVLWEGEIRNFFSLYAERCIQGHDDPKTLDDSLKDIPFDPSNPRKISDSTLTTKIRDVGRRKWAELGEVGRDDPKYTAAVKFAEALGVDEHTKVAVKICEPPGEDDYAPVIIQEVKDRFVQEYNAMMKVQHKYIVDEFGLILDPV